MSGFYIGYLPTAPADVAGKVRKLLGGIFAAVVAICVTIVVAQQPFSPSVFEYAKTRPIEGVLTFAPYPTLVVPRPGVAMDGVQTSQYLLVGTGKHGLSDDLRRFEGKPVHLDGKFIYRAEGTAIEVMPGSMRRSEASIANTATQESLGFAELKGEIVDSKCFLGVMNPGLSKVHRDCAVRCISGGIPPALLVSDDKRPRLYLLTDSTGQAMPSNRILDRVAEPVRVRGEVVRVGNTYAIKAQSIDRF